MVASPHALASGAGGDVLRAGGTAVDAAIATAAALGVLYPHMCGIGGDAFWLIHSASEKRIAYLDGGGRAAASATLERFQGRTEIPFWLIYSANEKRVAYLDGGGRALLRQRSSASRAGPRSPSG